MTDKKAWPLVVYEDDWLMVVDKPSGMVVNDAKTTTGLTVQTWQRERLGWSDLKSTEDNEFLHKSGVVHRLDKDTSGLLVLAKTEEAYLALKQQFMDRKVKKEYITLVHGDVRPERGVISEPIERHPKVWGKYAVGSDPARAAITEWEVIKKYSGSITQESMYSLLAVKPLTGRTHQIRVHLKHLGYPIVADPLYVGRKWLKNDVWWCPRLFLHAGKLELEHPESHEPKIFKADLPEDLVQTLEHVEARSSRRYTKVSE